MSAGPAAGASAPRGGPPSAWGRLLERRGPLLAALAAAVLALPGLGLPFLSDDWIQMEAAGADAPPPRTPFADFRPLYMATLWLDRRLWGLSPGPAHLANLVLIAAAAALVVIVARRYTGDARLAAGAGLLFALHPYHVENAAWIAARGDPLAAVPLLLAAAAYDRWRVGARGLPLTALLLFEMALLCKETAVVLAPALILIGLLDRTRRPPAGEWLRGHLALALVALGHFLLLRPWVLGGPGRTLLQNVGPRALETGLGFAVAAVVPAPVEVLAFRPALLAGLAAGTALGLVIVARLRSGAFSPIAASASLLFAALLLPSLVGFQERYFFLPAAASCLALAALLRDCRGAAAWTLGAFLAAGWVAGAAVHWRNWREAAVASRSLVDGLVQASQRPGVGEIVVANMPHRVRGGSVAGDFRAALLLSGGRPVPVRAAAWICYATAADDALDGPPGTAIRRPPAQPIAEVWLRVPGAPYFDFVGPLPKAPPGEGAARHDTPSGTLLFDGRGGVRVRIEPSPGRGRAAYAWVRGALRPLF
jgi:hypothetical protein